MSRLPYTVTPQDALKRLAEGNEKYLTTLHGAGNISPARRKDTCLHGQHPYAIIITCSDSRVIPEAIFSADIFGNSIRNFVLSDNQKGEQPVFCLFSSHMAFKILREASRLFPLPF